MAKPVILCVDDEPIILETLKRELRNRFDRKFTYETALGGQEALELIEELVTEGVLVVLILSDWLMPGLCGDEFLALVHSRWPSIHAILVTGHADPQAVTRVLEGELASYVVAKPWQTDELLGLVEGLLVS